MENKFGAALRELRKEKQLSQQILAKVLNTTKYTISSWELGKQEPNIAMIVSLAHFFNVTTDYLLGVEN